MIYSMTGYATSTIQFPRTSVQIDIKSVNHRFFDLTIKAPDEFKHLEQTIREKINAKIQRGKIDIRIYIKEPQISNSSFQLNLPLLKSYIQVAKEITVLTDVKPASITEIMALPGVLIPDSLALPEAEQVFFNEIERIIQQLLINQQTEGIKLAATITSKLDLIDNIIVQAQAMVPAILTSYKTKLKQKLLDSFADTEIINEQRFQQEFAHFCQKIDVDEELTRLKSHTTQMRNLLQNGGIIGKRIDFIIQEMHREANTFGAKSVALDTTELAVELKVLTEQIKEQIQNLM